MILISNSGHDERGKYSGGSAGDQGGEWSRINWYSRPWNYVLRYPDVSVGAVMAQLAGEAADNNRIGYDQSQRTTFYQQLKAVGWFPSKITTNCESDCSAGVAAIAIASGNILGISRLKALSPDIYTGNLRSAFSNAGFTVLTESKYLTSDQYLQPGDVLLYEGHHTAINLDWGSKTVPEKVTPDKLIAATKAVYLMAHNGHFRYGDSKTLPPCADGVISCDRLIARALWDLGYTDQPKGGITVSNEQGKFMGPYLIKWGATQINNESDIKAGDIVVMKRNGQSTPTADWHAYLATAVTRSGSVITINKYDMGSQERIDSPQPFINVPINQWPGSRSFYAIYRFGTTDKESEPYLFKPVTIRSGASGKSQFATTRILKARGYKGVKKDGVEQDLELNDSFSKGDVAALVKYKWDRLINGKNLCTGILADEANAKVYEDMFGMPLPIECVNVPAKCTRGPLILWLQEVLRSEGFVGKDGQPIGLDQEFGPNTEYAVKQYQKKYGFEANGKVTYSVWKHMCVNRTIK